MTRSLTANLRGVIKFTESSPRCTPSCAFSRQGQRALFRRRWHSRRGQRVSTLWPSHPLCTRFSGSSHPQMHSETLISSSAARPFLSSFFSLSHALAFTLPIQMFLPVYALIQTLWKETLDEGEGGLFSAALLPFRRPNAFGLTPPWIVDTESDGTQGSQVSPAGVRGGGRWGSDRVWEKLLCYASPDTFLPAAHIPQWISPSLWHQPVP